MSEIRCPLCHAADVEKVRDIHYREQDHSTNLWRCKHCDYHFVRPAPTDRFLNSFYDGQYGCFTADLGSWRRAAMFERLERIERLIDKRGRLLDVGCGNGNFCWVAQEKGWQVWGVDPIAHAVERAHPSIRDQLLVGTIKDLDFPESYFHVITFWAVIEHLKFPKVVLERAIDLLAPNGLLLLQLPYIRSFAARVYGSAWRLIANSPDHVGFLTLQTGKYLVRHYPFNLVGARIGGYPFPFGKAKQTMGRQVGSESEVVTASGRGDSCCSKGNLIVGFLSNPRLANVVRWVIHKCRLGDDIELVFRKHE